jgi:hypothetical protein
MMNQVIQLKTTAMFLELNTQVRLEGEQSVKAAAQRHPTQVKNKTCQRQNVINLMLTSSLV